MEQGNEKKKKTEKMWAKLLEIAKENNTIFCKKFYNQQEPDDYTQCSRSIDDDMRQLCGEKNFPPPQLINTKQIYISDLKNKTISDVEKNAAITFVWETKNIPWSYEVKKDAIIREKQLCVEPLQKINDSYWTLAQEYPHSISCYLILKYDNKHILLGWTNFSLTIPKNIKYTFEHNGELILKTTYSCVPPKFQRKGINTFLRDYVIKTLLTHYPAITTFETDLMAKSKDGTFLAEPISKKYGMKCNNQKGISFCKGERATVLTKINERMGSNSQKFDNNLKILISKLVNDNLFDANEGGGVGKADRGGRRKRDGRKKKRNKKMKKETRKRKKTRKRNKSRRKKRKTKRKRYKKY